jgi:transcriptional regulator with XRE-family HTH domain
MARAALQMGVRELAEVAKVSTNTITRFERGEPLKGRTIDAVRAALESAGVEFMNGGQPGVRMKIYVDAGQRATLRFGDRSVACFTLEEAKMAWDRLPAAQKEQAIIEVDDGPTYQAEQIDRLYYGPKPPA